MKNIRFYMTLATVLITAMGAVFLGQLGREQTAELDQSSQYQVERSFGQLPLLFVENQGQWDGQVAYGVQGNDKMLYFTAEGVTFALTAPTEAGEDEPENRPDFGSRHMTSKAVRTERWTVKLDFLGANPNVIPVGEVADSAVISYFKGQQDDWQTGLPTFRRIVYYDLWPGIDLVYEGTVNRLKYHFVVEPGADPNQIRLAYRGASDVSVNTAGQLVVETPLGSFEDDTPVAYQEIDGEWVLVDMGYVLEDGTAELQPYHFEIGKYDAERPLILDPVILVYSGFIGGSGSDNPWAIDLDEAGNVYITGETTSNEATFPVQVGPDLTQNGNSDAFVVKVNASGTELIYAGYIGGSNYDLGTSIKVDAVGNAYITGFTLSDETTFPTLIGPDLTHNGDYDAFVAKINPNGSGLIYSGYIGGSGADLANQLALDNNGNVFIVGNTESDESTFPVIIGPDLSYNDTGDYFDGFVTKVNAAGTGLDYSGYIGGSEIDDAVGIDVDSFGNAYVTGVTTSDENSFPVLVGPELTYDDRGDAFITKINPTGDTLIYSGYIGGDGEDAGLRIALDEFDNAYITGSTGSDESTFPVVVGPDLTFNGYLDAFVAKVSPGGSDLVFAGYIGGLELEQSGGIVVDAAGSAYIVGYTESNEVTFPVFIGPDLTFNGGMDDGFVAKINPDGQSLSFAGYIGGSGSDAVFNLAVDSVGNVYLTGYTSSDEATFPVMDGPDLTYNGGGDGFVAKFAQVYPPQEVDIVGLMSGTSGSSYVFTATTATITTSVPLTYSWFATGQIPVTHTNGLTDTAEFTWYITGTKTITVTAWNLGGLVTNTHTITISSDHYIYLPIVFKP